MKEERIAKILNSLEEHKILFFKGILHEELKFINIVGQLEKYLDKINNIELKTKTKSFIESVKKHKNYKIVIDSIAQKKQKKIELEEKRELKKIELKKQEKTRLQELKNIEAKKQEKIRLQKLKEQAEIERESSEKLEFINNNLKLLEMLTERYSFEGFFHTTNFENFINIMKNKKLCYRNYLKNNNIDFNDVANQDVITKQIKEHDYVRFYFRPKTPTNYMNEGIKCKKSLNKQNTFILNDGSCKVEENNKQQSAIPIIMIFAKKIIQNHICRYKQSNKMNSILFNRIQDLKYWRNIFSTQDPYELTKDAKQCRMAELLIPKCISTNYIEKIIFRSILDKERAIKILNEKDARFIVDNSYFFNNYLYVKSYKFTNKDKIKIIFDYNIGECLYKDRVNLNDYQHSLKFYKKSKFIKEYTTLDFKKNMSYFIIPDNLQWDYMTYSIENNICVEVYND